MLATETIVLIVLLPFLALFLCWACGWDRGGGYLSNGTFAKAGGGNLSDIEIAGRGGGCPRTNSAEGGGGRLLPAMVMVPKSHILEK